MFVKSKLSTLIHNARHNVDISSSTVQWVSNVFLFFCFMNNKVTTYDRLHMNLFEFSIFFKIRLATDIFPHMLPTVDSLKIAKSRCLGRKITESMEEVFLYLCVCSCISSLSSCCLSLLNLNVRKWNSSSKGFYVQLMSWYQ